MSENDEKVVPGGTMWTPNTYADSNAAYQAAFWAKEEQRKKDFESKRRRQGLNVMLLGLIVLTFISVLRIHMALSSNASNYYSIPDVNNAILTIISLTGSVAFGYGAGTFILGIPKKKFLLIPAILLLVAGLAFSIPATAAKIVNDNFNSWLESTYSLSSFVDGNNAPKIEDLADEKVAMVNTDGDKVTVTFSTKDNKVTVLDVAPVIKEEK